MTQKWNLQDIKPADNRKRKNESAGRTRPKTKPVESSNDESEPLVLPSVKKTGGSKLKVTFIALLVIIVATFGLTTVLSKTTLSVAPIAKEPNVNAQFTAYSERQSGELSYEIMTLDATSEREVTATGQQEVEEQAKGFINIIKTTAGSERLIKNTRFRSPDGLVFRIQESVVVPGATSGPDGEILPGTIKAEVFADDVGQQYNLEAGVKFDIPGFKESGLTELYNSISAESASAFTGGFKGPRFVIDDTELVVAKESLQSELQEILLARVDAEKPAGFVAFKESLAITYNELPAERSGDNMVVIKEQAVLQLPLFDNEEFARYIAGEVVTTYSGEPVQIRNIEDLKFAYTDSNTSSANIANLDSLAFSIVGKPLIVWEYNAGKLQEDLAGKPFTAISTVLTGHTGIRAAEISEKPFWKRSFPAEAEKITIVEKIEVK